MNEKILNDLITKISKLPTLGRKSSTKIVYKLLNNSSRKELEGLIDSLIEAKTKVSNCQICNNLTEHGICEYCSNTERLERGKIIVVADPQDISIIESASIHDGTYFVLNGLLNPLKGLYLDDIGLHEFVTLLSTYQINEVTCALSTSPEGVHTVAAITTICNELSVKCYQLATGVPVGATFTNVDTNTLVESLINRKQTLL